MKNKKYQLIYADPPWSYQKWVWKEKSIKDLESIYPTMSLEQIKRLPVPAEEDCWLVLWTTVPKIIEGSEVLKAWGFDYRTSGIWDKGNGLGFFFRIYHEILLIGKKGNPTKPLRTFPSVFRESRRKHSQKPDCVRAWIEGVFPNLSRIELFAREKPSGWDVWGNEVESDIKLEKRNETK